MLSKIKISILDKKFIVFMTHYTHTSFYKLLRKEAIVFTISYSILLECFVELKSLSRKTKNMLS